MPEAKLSEAELYIMQQFWAHGPMKTDQLAPLVAARGWKATTLLTFLSRLVAKGMLAAQKQGKGNLYRPLVGQEAWLGQESRSMVDTLFGGSARNFLAAMVQGGSLSADEVRELKTWLDEQEVE